MTKEEIKEYLREHLSIETEFGSRFCDSDPYVRVILKLEDEEISYDYVNLD